MTTQRSYLLGLDVGSTTVKVVVIDGLTHEICWQAYERHETRQAQCSLEMIAAVEQDLGLRSDNCRAYATGSGARTLADEVGARFVQEVNAVSLAVEALHPEAGSVVELGGQDAKIIIFRIDPKTVRRQKFSSMNDKCAGGTGAVIDKISAKLGIPAQHLSQMGYDGQRLHAVAGKCGVFAETDINSLQKVGVPSSELMASLFEAIVAQNLSILTRGNTLQPQVLLLGGPNTFIRGLAEAWRYNIARLWTERGIDLPAGTTIEDQVIVPAGAQYFAALGAARFGLQDEMRDTVFLGSSALKRFVSVGQVQQKRKAGSEGLIRDSQELAAFRERFAVPDFAPAQLRPGQKVSAFLGLDGGSTSTKAVLLDEQGRVLFKAYQLSKGNPIEDAKEVISTLADQMTTQTATVEVLGVATTGYAKDILHDVLQADVALVETVAHARSALHSYKDVDVICDVGGQDIKIILLANGRVKDFKLNTQCSAGNGYFLQSTAESLGIAVDDYADRAFTAQVKPDFGYGCAVFMQSDIVDFQRRGWSAEEIMAGLAAVLPKNIWLYVAQIPNLASLGTNFVLQGGTQKNLAAVKAQVDFIEDRFLGKRERPRIVVHEHCGESGAIGAALEAITLWQQGHPSRFIGLDAVQNIQYALRSDEQTRCHFCTNGCLRTFIDVDDDESTTGPRRLIVGNSCEKGAVEHADQVRHIAARWKEQEAEVPNLQDIAATQVWRKTDASPVPQTGQITWTRRQRHRRHLREKRPEIRIGVPRVLNLYSLNPLFRAYFESLGITDRNIVYSDYTSEAMFREGSKRGSIDPCFPSKACIAHVHNLLTKHHERRPLDMIFLPMIDCLPTDLVGTQACRACPAVTTTPAAVKAAFTKEGDQFAARGIRFVDTFVNPGEPQLFERQMREAFEPLLGVSAAENRHAIDAGYQALRHYEVETLQGQGERTLRRLEEENGVGIVLLGRPYHADPGIGHGILEQFQRRGYPVLTQDSLPRDAKTMHELFGAEVAAGIIDDPLDISDVWLNSYSENTNRKL
ncbi:MAG: CoA activase, partial [Gemmatimonadetes bacterium]|nr:CoA activase [Gemmatimonadota bacterium]